MQHIQGGDRNQTLLLPAAVDDYVSRENPVRFIEAFVDQCDLQAAGVECQMVLEQARRHVPRSTPSSEARIVGVVGLRAPYCGKRASAPQLSRLPMQHGFAGGCFSAVSSPTGLGLALAKESRHGAVCWPGC